MANMRTDSWAAKLTEEQQWELYGKSKQSDTPWTQVVKWAVQEYGLDKTPSQSAFYRWRDSMRKDEIKHRIDEVICSTNKFFGAIPDDELVATFKTLAAEAALNGDAKTAAILIQCTATLHDHALKQLDYDQKERERIIRERTETALWPATMQILQNAMQLNKPKPVDTPTDKPEEGTDQNAS